MTKSNTHAHTYTHTHKLTHPHTVVRFPQGGLVAECNYRHKLLLFERHGEKQHSGGYNRIPSIFVNKYHIVGSLFCLVGARERILENKGARAMGEMSLLSSMI